MKKIIILLTFFIIMQGSHKSQTILGYSGLVTIPTAELKNDGSLACGINFMPKEYISFKEFKYDALLFNIDLTFLHFLELGFSITRVLNVSSEVQAIGDRSIFIRLKLMTESDYIPGLSFGIHDPYGPGGGEDAIHNNSLYIVTTKNFRNLLFFDNIGVTFGYGSDIIKAADHQFLGLFGGISCTFSLLTSDFSLLAEYDAERVNAGMRVTLFEHVKLLAGLMGMRYFSGGVAYQFQL